MDSTVIVTLAVVFLVIAVVTSLIYYFARYYVKTDADDRELLTKKPVKWREVEERDSTEKEAPPVEIGEEPPPKPSPKLPPKEQLPPRRLGDALAKTQSSFWGRIKNLASNGEIRADVREELEEILYTSDLGPATAERLLNSVTDQLSRSERRDVEAVRASLRAEMNHVFAETKTEKTIFEKIAERSSPTVWMIVGVNGVGKTTTIGKLASLAKAQGLKTLIVAGDTFRAAADSQLQAWAERAGCEFFRPESVKDPSAVAYSGLEKAKALGCQLVLIDTAGRLHTQEHLMEELKKMKRVMSKVVPDAPQEVLLVIDANAGQNALQQARQFHTAVDLTGVVITKLDGSSKAGVAVGVAFELKIPITYVGIGESVEDLRPFEPQAFVEAIV